MSDASAQEREKIYGKAMERYWNDAEFHARAVLAMQLLPVGEDEHSLRRNMVMAVYLGAAPIEELMAPGPSPL